MQSCTSKLKSNWKNGRKPIWGYKIHGFFQNKEMPFYYFKVHEIAYAKFKSFVSKWGSQWSDGHISIVGM